MHRRGFVSEDVEGDAFGVVEGDARPLRIASTLPLPPSLRSAEGGVPERFAARAAVVGARRGPERSEGAFSMAFVPVVVHDSGPSSSLGDAGFAAAAPLDVRSERSLVAAVGSDLRGLITGRGASQQQKGQKGPRPITLSRAGSPQQPLLVFPPIFDTRLYYRFAHEPYVIEDQEDCASCVFIAAATCAKVRGGVQRDLPVMNAARVWRQMLREEGGSEAKVSSGAGEEVAAYRRASERFCALMCERAAKRGVDTALSLPLLDWRRFICCGGNETHDSCGARSLPERCYHHRDGDPREAAFHCSLHSEGVVPLHFVEWVSGVGFHCAASGTRVVEAVAPETSRGFALTEPVQISAASESLGEEEAAAMAEQVRQMKTSLMTHGPVMAMMRIDGRSFDAWGGRNPVVNGKSLYARSGRRRGGASAAEEEAAEEEAAAAEAEAAEAAAEAEAEAEAEAAEAEAEAAAAAATTVESRLAGMGRGTRSGAPKVVGRSEGATSPRSGSSAFAPLGVPPSAAARAGRGAAAAVRAGYVLPGRDVFDEFHEVTVVGWGFDDEAQPCWVVLNSYGEGYNDACAPGGAAADAWLSSLLTDVSRRGYAPSGIADKGGAVFVRMVSASMLREGRSTDLENNVISFVPRVGASITAKPPQHSPPFYDPMARAVHVAGAGGRRDAERSEGGRRDAERSEGGSSSLRSGAARATKAARADLRDNAEIVEVENGGGGGGGGGDGDDGNGRDVLDAPSSSWAVGAGMAAAIVAVAAWGSVRGLRRRG